MISAYIALARPGHWIKNILVFVPLVYAHRLTDSGLLLSVFLCFVSFCLMSSAVYMINDILDAPYDRMHPSKRMRPIAAGLVTPRAAALLAVVLAAASLCLSLLGSMTIILSVYLLLNLA